MVRRPVRVDGRRSGRDLLDLAVAKRARINRRYVEGSDPTPAGKYDEVELARLGEDGKALAKHAAGTASIQGSAYGSAEK
jgi:hypothetical protein